MARKRNHGEGTWGKKEINGISYFFYRDANKKYFYGKTQKEVNEKIKQSQNKNINVVRNNYVVIDYLREWLDIVVKNSVASKTLDNYEFAINRIEKYAISGITIDSLNSRNVQDFINQLAKKYSLATIQKTYRVFNLAIKYAVENGDIDEMPYAQIRLPKEKNVAVKKKEASFLSPEEMGKLYKESKRINEPGFNFGGINGTPVYGINAFMLVFIAFTGLRSSEAKALTWQNVNLKEKEIYIESATVVVKNRNIQNENDQKYIEENKEPKSAKSKRTVPLGDIAIEMLDNMNDLNPKHKPKDLVFINKVGTSPSESNLLRTLDAMLQRAGCNRCTVHGLRHSFGSLLISNGADIKYVAEVLGHSNISTTYDIYINLTKDDIGDKVRKYQSVPMD